MKLPELNLLAPNQHTTFKKLVEEISECNTALEILTDFEGNNNNNWLMLSDSEVERIRLEYKEKLNDVLGEIMDIAQVCASQLFVFESTGVNIEKYFKDYMEKEGTVETSETIFYKENNCRHVYMPRTTGDTTIQSTMNKIILSMGTVAQLGKFVGENGEVPIMCGSESDKKHIEEMFYIIRNCFNLIYSMESKYEINIEDLFSQHIDKLKLKGYCN